MGTISQDGTFKALKRGKVTIFAYCSNGEIHEVKTIKILEKDFVIVIEGPNIVNKGERFKITASTVPTDIETEFSYSAFHNTRHNRSESTDDYHRHCKRLHSSASLCRCIFLFHYEAVKEFHT